MGAREAMGASAGMGVVVPEMRGTDDDPATTPLELPRIASRAGASPKKVTSG